MENIELKNETEDVEYIPEDPNTPVDDFEISEIEIEGYMPEELKNAIRRYNEIHKRTIDDLMHSDEENDADDDSCADGDIIEDENNSLDLKNIF